MSTLHQAEKKILAQGSTGCDFKTVWLGRISTFPKIKNFF
jgi:hypothetical protein